MIYLEALMRVLLICNEFIAKNFINACVIIKQKELRQIKLG